MRQELEGCLYLGFRLKRACLRTYVVTPSKFNFMPFKKFNVLKIELCAFTKKIRERIVLQEMDLARLCAVAGDV